MTLSRLALLISAVVLVVLLGLGGGFVWFIRSAFREADLPATADGIVALTGGADRVETALRLLAEHRANWLLLSGIGGGAELTDLARRGGLDPTPLKAHVTLGRQARTTHGNALETAAWAHAHDIHALIVVTAFYHMPRAMTELQRELPGVLLYEDPVLLPAAGTTAHSIPVRLMFSEYSKYLLALFGVSAVIPVRDQEMWDRVRAG